MTSLLVRGGTVVDERAARVADVLIRDGRVVDVAAGLSVQVDEVLDARGLHVLPGLVDGHVHFNEPGRTDWEGFLSGTAAAAAGGVSTVCDMPLNSHPPTLDARALALKRGAIADHAHVDFACWGGVVPQSIDHLPELQAAGVIGVKAFLCDSGLPEYPPLDEFALLEAMQRCADLGLLLALHAEAPDHLDPRDRDWLRARPAEAEIVAVERSLDLAVETGARVHFVHISTAAAARRIAQARLDGQDVSVETCPHYLTLDADDFARLGAIAKCAPPLRPRAVVEALWQGVFDGAIDYIASDHSPCPPAMKQAEPTWGGISGVQTTLPLLLTEGFFARGLPVSRLVTLLSAAPARRLGLYPRKGSLEPGADADLVLVDLDRAWRLEERALHTRWPISPFVGRALRGQVVQTLVRGQVVYDGDDGSIRVEPGYGRAV